ncbi:GNAT family N-acetyltransferase [Alginatibacterium sediminis]|uniref:GNAT family N-acetyltransferase n=1 Tax=Alginatibacterium sediminis TaxID=2164068 RepID=A0A420E819_9ALTE|nr:GNAT family N-acetyltransferase [Alginatibacterium sediminis]RKF15626.1 GNAT family N-acetyltransferase [Alginatibacterium sediminis]
MSEFVKHTQASLQWYSPNMDELNHEFWNKWDELRHPAHANFINSSTWMKNWLQVFWDPNWKLEIHIAKCKQQVVAILPLYIKSSKTSVVGKYLCLLGQGEPPEAGVASEYLDILCLEPYQEDVSNYFRTILYSGRFFEFRAKDLHQDSFISENLTKGVKNADIQSTYRFQQTSPKPNILESLSKNTRKRYNRSKNQLLNSNIGFKCLDTESYESAWERMKEMHQTRWLSLGHTGAFSEPKFNDFHRNMIARHPENVLMSGLFIDNKAIALNFYYLSNDTLHFYQSGWDQDQNAKLSPGVNLHILSMLNNPVSNYDYMKSGQAQSYKEKLSNKKTPMLSLVLALNWQSRFLLRLKKIKRLALTQIAKHRDHFNSK